MATVRLSDIIDVTVFQDLPSVNSPEKTAFVQSGAMVMSDLLNGIANSAGKRAELPFWKDLDGGSEADLSSDDPNVNSTPEKIVQGEQVARKLFLNKSWQASDLASELAAGPNALQRVRDRVDAYWMKQLQRRLISACDGVLADNLANDGGDMVNDISIEDGSNAGAGNVFSRTAFTGAAFTLGDAFEDTGAVAMHSVVYKRAVDNDDIDFIRDSQGNLLMATYMGRQVIVDDGLTVTAGATSGFKYTTVLFGAGALGYGNGSPLVPVATDRSESGGNGGGIETLTTRKTWIVHPFGYQFTGTPVGESPSIAEFKVAGSWDRVVERKNVPLCFIITNG